MDRRIKSQQEILDITRTMGSFIEINELLDHVLDKILSLFQFQVAAFYLFSHEDGLLYLKSTRGASNSIGKETSLKVGEGIIGATAQKKNIQILNDIPKDTVFTIKNILGESLPNQLVTIPVYFQDKLMGVVALAGFYSLAENYLNTLEIITHQLGIAIANALSYDLLRHQAEELRKKGERLELQNEELQAQAEELEAQSEELSAQQKELEAQNSKIQESDRLKTEFLTNISHELRTPLNSIIIFSNLLLDRIPGELNEEQEKQLGIIVRNGKSLLQMINDLLDLSRIEAGRMEINNQPFPLELLLNEIKEAIAPFVAEKGLKFNLMIEEKLPMITTDRQRLNQILLNLLNNAIKFTHEGEIGLKVKILNDDGVVQFKVWDTGIGIKEADQEIIFHEFRQIDGSSTRSYGGAGLGLAIVKKFVLLLRGKIGVESQPEQGSVFTVSIPIIPRDDDLIEVENGLKQEEQAYTSEYNNEQSKEIKTQQPEKRILIIGADQVSTRSLISILKPEQYTVNSLSDRSMIRFKLDELKPDLIILDLPGFDEDNFSVLEIIKADPEHKAIPIIILTSKEIDFKVKRFISSRCSQIIRKGMIRKDEFLRDINIALKGM